MPPFKGLLPVIYCRWYVAGGMLPVASAAGNLRLIFIFPGLNTVHYIIVYNPEYLKIKYNEQFNPFRKQC